MRQRFGFGAEDIVLGYVGRLAPEKNLNMLMDAMEILSAQDPRLRLLLVGDGPSRESLEARSATGDLAGKVAFAGNVDHGDVPAYDAALNLFITASMSEVQPLSFAEAMAAGAPVVAMDAPGGSDMIDDHYNGRLVPPDEAGAGMARCVREVLADPSTLPKMSEQAKLWAQRYDKPAVVQRLLEVYDRAIASAAKSD
ncbi:MAG: glycosyltransferase [Armatimonadota bacterium]